MKTETHYVNPDLQDARESASFLYGEMHRLQALNAELVAALQKLHCNPVRLWRDNPEAIRQHLAAQNRIIEAALAKAQAASNHTSKE